VVNKASFSMSAKGREINKVGFSKAEKGCGQSSQFQHVWKLERVGLTGI
jgi:hypothetical protein